MRVVRRELEARRAVDRRERDHAEKPAGEVEAIGFELSVEGGDLSGRRRSRCFGARRLLDGLALFALGAVLDLRPFGVNAAEQGGALAAVGREPFARVAVEDEARGPKRSRCILVCRIST